MRWTAALADEKVVRRFEALVRSVRGHDWWTGAIVRSGHGRFWIGRTNDGRGDVVAAHRFAFALGHGLEALMGAEAVMHLCDEPLCQRSDHLAAGTRAENCRAWMARRHDIGSPHRDCRGRLARSRMIRDAVRDGGDVTAVIDAGVSWRDLERPPLLGLEVVSTLAGVPAAPD
ncbi:MAG: hypothetical protein LBJ44_07260 [Propionibacteriaceae bacterium]|nr:hypothetical protein [Propionibacteriaceae bacterium]